MPSQAKSSWGISIFELKPSCRFFWCIGFFRLKLIFSCFYKVLNKKPSYFKKKKETIARKIRGKKSENQEITIFWFLCWNKIFELKEKGHKPSQAENPSAWLGLITSNYHILTMQPPLTWVTSKRAAQIFFQNYINSKHLLQQLNMIWLRCPHLNLTASVDRVDVKKHKASQDFVFFLQKTTLLELLLVWHNEPTFSLGK